MLIINMLHDTSANWAAINPVLAEDQPGYEDDTSKFKIGDGVTTWVNLPYFVSQTSGSGTTVSDAALLAHVNSSAPHPVYDDGPSLALLYQNAKV